MTKRRILVVGIRRGRTPWRVRMSLWAYLLQTAVFPN